MSQEYPTLAFHASLTNSFGKGSLIQLLRQFGKVSTTETPTHLLLKLEITKLSVYLASQGYLKVILKMHIILGSVRKIFKINS